jgi:hypothetical protein
MCHRWTHVAQFLYIIGYIALYADFRCTVDATSVISVFNSDVITFPCLQVGLELELPSTLVFIRGLHF